MLLYSRNQHNMVKQLFSNLKKAIWTTTGEIVLGNLVNV